VKVCVCERKCLCVGMRAMLTYKMLMVRVRVRVRKTHKHVRDLRARF
jgi:hypothetical protein